MPTRYEQYRKANPAKGDIDVWYNEPWNEGKYGAYLVMKNTPIFKQILNLYEARRDNSEYMENHGIDWSDVTHPDRLPGTNRLSQVAFGSINFVSDNVKRLYR